MNNANKFLKGQENLGAQPVAPVTQTQKSMGQGMGIIARMLGKRIDLTKQNAIQTEKDPR